MAHEELKSLSPDDLDGVVGGFTFESVTASEDWMNGQSVKCPYCGNSDKNTIHQGAVFRTDSAYFICNKCGKPFQFRVAKKDFNARTGEWTYDITSDPATSDKRF